VRDILMVAVLIFAFAIGFFVIHFAMTQTVDQIITNPVINQSNQSVEMFSSIKSGVDRLDYVIFGIFVAFVLVIILISWFMAGNGIFMFIYILVSLIATFLSIIISSVWEDVSQASVFGTTVTYFPITNNILSNLAIYVAVLALIGLVIQFGKPAVREY